MHLYLFMQNYIYIGNRTKDIIILQVAQHLHTLWHYLTQSHKAMIMRPRLVYDFAHS